jgi:hypothetical protein
MNVSGGTGTLLGSASSLHLLCPNALEIECHELLSLLVLLSGLRLEANNAVSFLPVFTLLPKLTGVPVKDQVFFIAGNVELEAAASVEIVQGHLSAVEAEYLSGYLGNVMRVRGFDGVAQQEPSATLLDDRLKFVGAVTASSASGPASIQKHHRLERFHHYLLGVKKAGPGPGATQSRRSLARREQAAGWIVGRMVPTSDIDLRRLTFDMSGSRSAARAWPSMK